MKDTEAKDRQVEVKSVKKTDFDAIYKGNVGYVYATAIKYTKNHHTAEEIVQNVFLKYYVNMENTDADAARAWLILTTKYMALNEKRDHRKEYLVGEVDIKKESNLSGYAESPEDVFERKSNERKYMELKEDIFEALYEKNPRWYDVITITYILGKPQKEVAENMGITLDVLHSTLYRAKQWIRKNYAEEYAHLSNV